MCMGLLAVGRAVVSRDVVMPALLDAGKRKGILAKLRPLPAPEDEAPAPSRRRTRRVRVCLLTWRLHTSLS
jgi:hypothetical protein